MKAAALLGRIVYGLCLILVGGILAIGGARLIALGGSPYYLPVGLLAAASGALVLWGKWSKAAAVFCGDSTSPVKGIGCRSTGYRKIDASVG